MQAQALVRHTLSQQPNEGIVGNEQAFDLSTHSFTVSQQPSTQPPVLNQFLTCHCILLLMLSLFQTVIDSDRTLCALTTNYFGKQTLGVLYYNARSLLPKFDELSGTLNTLKTQYHLYCRVLAF